MAKQGKSEKQEPSLFQNEERPAPQMPVGYYSGDQPNPNLRAFVETHLQRARPDQGFAPQPYLKTIKATRADPVYNMHSYPSKKPFDAVERYIRNFSVPGDLVLDPFCGSGGTLYCALKSERTAIGIDLSPAAVFISRGLCTPYPAERFRSAAEELVQRLEHRFSSWYATTCGECSGSATIRTIAWSMLFRCPRCLAETPLYEAESENAGGSGKGRCPCGEVLKSRDKVNRWVPVRVEYRCEAGCGREVRQRTRTGPTREEAERFAEDQERIARQEEALAEPGPGFPEFEFPERARVQVLRSRGISRHSQVYSHRNRAVAEALWEAIQQSPEDLRESLRFWFTASILSLTLFERDREGGGGYQSGTMYVPYNCKDRQPFHTLRSKIGHIARGLESLAELSSTTVCLSTQEAGMMPQIPSNSVDYVFTDPPYGDKVQYWELSCIWEAWLGFKRNWAAQEAVINHPRGLDEERWNGVMRQCLGEIYRVLRPGRYLTLCFHGTDTHWTTIQDLCCEIGFLPDQATEATAIDALQKSFKQLKTEEDNVRRDLVVNFRKPDAGQLALAISLTGDEDETTFSEKARTIIREHLTAHPGATKDLVYDELISHMVRAGRMEPHNFDQLLRQVAEPVQPESADGSGRDRARWFLKETETVVVDAAESAKEDAAAESLAAFIQRTLEANPAAEGVHYSGLFEHYVYTIPTKDKPRRPLAEWLLDYFYKTPEGTYRLPESEEEERLKAEGRTQGLGRRIKRYLSYFQQGVAVPEKERPSGATLAEWIRHCRRSGLFEPGRLLFERSGAVLESLSDEAQVEVEEDYEVCVRGTVRAASVAAKPKRGRPQGGLGL